MRQVCHRAVLTGQPEPPMVVSIRPAGLMMAQ
jgi:hypothetical protein